MFVFSKDKKNKINKDMTDVELTLDQRLFDAVTADDVDTAAELLQRGADPNHAGEYCCALFCFFKKEKKQVNNYIFNSKPQLQF